MAAMANVAKGYDLEYTWRSRRAAIWLATCPTQGLLTGSTPESRRQTMSGGFAWVSGW
jgi:hypothetical protein